MVLLKITKTVYMTCICIPTQAILKLAIKNQQLGLEWVIMFLIVLWWLLAICWLPKFIERIVLWIIWSYLQNQMRNEISCLEATLNQSLIQNFQMQNTRSTKPTLLWDWVLSVRVFKVSYTVYCWNITKEDKCCKLNYK